MYPQNKSKKIYFSIFLFAISLILFSIYFAGKYSDRKSVTFDGTIALEHIKKQLSFGPRIPGTLGHDQAVTWIIDSIEEMHWYVHIQEVSSMGHPIKNIIAKQGGHENQEPWIIFAAHYDTRIFADQSDDLADRAQPVAGANDGASGVAILLELARVIPRDFPGEVWLVFFDAEDNGEIDGWDWIMGSRAFVDLLEGYPDAVILVDMIGDADLNIFIEKNSDPDLSTGIWEQAAALGYIQYFVPLSKYRMLDDHIPFIEAGIPAVDLIDFDYPYWHTTEDTIDKVSAESLNIVGDTLLSWLATKQ